MSERNVIVVVVDWDVQSMKFAFNTQISDHIGQSFLNPFQPKSSEQYLKTLGPKGRSLVCSLMGLPGVVQVQIFYNSVVVTKGEAYSWRSLELHILDTIHSIIWPDRGRPVVGTCRLHSKIDIVTLQGGSVLAAEEERKDRNESSEEKPYLRQLYPVPT